VVDLLSTMMQMKSFRSQRGSCSHLFGLRLAHQHWSFHLHADFCGSCEVKKISLNFLNEMNCCGKKQKAPRTRATNNEQSAILSDHFGPSFFFRTKLCHQSGYKLVQWNAYTVNPHM
jgi:hypothetical protein